MPPTRAEVHAILKEKFGDAVLEEQLEVRDPFIVVRPEKAAEVARFVHDDPRLRLDLLTAVVGIDYFLLR